MVNDAFEEMKSGGVGEWEKIRGCQGNNRGTWVTQGRMPRRDI